MTRTSFTVSRAAALALRCALGAGAVAATTGVSAALPASDVTKATLANGLRVVIVRNPLAPVVATDLTYLVGSRDDPPSVPGMAHAQEHMMFRGTPNLSTSELGTLATALGGGFNAETSETVTQFKFTVPAPDLDAVLRVEADRMRDVLDAQSEWQNERGAIEQEVLRDETSPGADFYRDAQAAALAGSPYEHDGVGTRAAFDKLTGPQLKAFWKKWYAPNNAVLVVAGDVDPAAALAQIRARFEAIPSHPIPAHAQAHFEPLKRTVFERKTSLIFSLAAVGFRLPGLRDPDFLASYVLQAILNSPRGPLRALVDSGDALDGEWDALPYLPEAQVGFAIAALRPSADPTAMTKRLGEILTGYAKHGVPPDLFAATKRRLIADQELSRNSIEALADDWATTIAVDGEPSIAREQQLIAAVTVADVDRVAKRSFDMQHAVIGALTPSANAYQNAAPAPPQTGSEKPLAEQPPVVALPNWAQQLVDHPTLAPATVAPFSAKLSNGLSLVVVPETISDSVFVFGRVRSDPSIQEPFGQEGVGSVLDAMFEEGTATRDRTAFARAQDDIDSTVGAGTGFGAQTTSRNFERALALLAENELQPRFDETTFQSALHRTTDALATNLTSTSTILDQRAAQKLLPPGDPQLRFPTVAGLRSLTLDDVKAYDAHVFRPDVTTIVVVGNVTADAAKGAVEKAFGAWTATGAPPALALPPVPLNAPADVNLSVPGLSQDSVSYEQIVPLTRASPDFYPLELGDAILGGGSIGPEQSRLFRDLRQNAGLVYTTGSQFGADEARARFAITFACSPANEPRIRTLVDDEIARLQREPVGAFELALVKASLVRRTIVAEGSESSVGGSLLSAASDGRPLDQNRIDAGKLLETDAAAIRSAFAADIHPDHFVRVVEGP